MPVVMNVKLHMPTTVAFFASENQSPRLLEYGKTRRLRMADHLDAPGLMSPNSDPRVDITDHYAFQKPGNPNKTILIINVNPLSPTLANSFEHTAVYEIKVDTDADAVAEIAFRITFSPLDDGTQKATVRRATGDEAAGKGWQGKVIIEDAPVNFDSSVTITRNGPYKFY